MDSMNNDPPSRLFAGFPFLNICPVTKTGDLVVVNRECLGIKTSWMMSSLEVDIFLIKFPVEVNYTPPKFIMEPENQPLEKEIPIGNHHFQVPC